MKFAHKYQSEYIYIYMYILFSFRYNSLIVQLFQTSDVEIHTKTKVANFEITWSALFIFMCLIKIQQSNEWINLSGVLTLCTNHSNCSTFFSLKINDHYHYHFFVQVESKKSKVQKSSISTVSNKILGYYK
jgi:hypothetical protein